LQDVRAISFRIEALLLQFSAEGLGLANGQFLPINQNQALFALLGTTYGGNGQTTSRCRTCAAAWHPRGATAIRWARRRLDLGDVTQQMPQHVHFEQGSTANAARRADRQRARRGNNLTRGRGALTPLLRPR
jgi:microcystin-dependent protein